LKSIAEDDLYTREVPCAGLCGTLKAVLVGSSRSLYLWKVMFFIIFYPLPICIYDEEYELIFGIEFSNL
jgi:hypothetical protein